MTKISTFFDIRNHWFSQNEEYERSFFCKKCKLYLYSADYPVVMDLIKRTFRHVQRSEHLSLAEMRDSGLFIPELSLVAEIDERKIVGHHMHNFPFFKRILLFQRANNQHDD